MSLLKSLSFLFTLIVLISCRNNTAENNSANQKNTVYTIDLQPFNDVSSEQVKFVFTELKKIYPSVILKQPLPLPAEAFYKKRNRYRADSIIHYLDRRTSGHHVTIGITTKDISTTKDKVEDWGIMGLAFCPGKACVVSTFRLAKKERGAQLFKVSIHELGHTQGLPHCAEKFCFMRDAEGGNPINDETRFCLKCNDHLAKRGWIF